MSKFHNGIINLQNNITVCESSLSEITKEHLHDGNDFLPFALNSAIIEFDTIITLNKNNSVAHDFYITELFNIVKKSKEVMMDEIETDIAATSGINDTNSKCFSDEFIDYLVCTVSYHDHAVKHPELIDEEPEMLKFNNLEHLDDEINALFINECIKFGIKSKVFSETENIINLTPDKKHPDLVGFSH